MCVRVLLPTGLMVHVVYYEGLVSNFRENRRSKFSLLKIILIYQWNKHNQNKTIIKHHILHLHNQTHVWKRYSYLDLSKIDLWCNCYRTEAVIYQPCKICWMHVVLRQPKLLHRIIRLEQEFKITDNHFCRGRSPANTSKNARSTVSCKNAVSLY